MAKLWTANKTWQGNTTPAAGTKYLVGAASGKCSYQTFSAGQTKRCLVSNGANGNIAYQNVTMPLPDMTGDANIVPKDKILYFQVPNSDDGRIIGWDGTGSTFILSADAANHRYIFSDNADKDSSAISGDDLVLVHNLDKYVGEEDWNTNVKPVVQSWKKIEVWQNSSTGWHKKCLVTISKWTENTIDYRFGLRGTYTVTEYAVPLPNPIQDYRVVIFK